MNVNRAPWRRGVILVAAIILAVLVFGSLAALAVAAPGSPSLQKYTGVVTQPSSLLPGHDARAAQHAGSADAAAVRVTGGAGTGHISGRITNAAGGAGLADIEVVILDADGEEIVITSTDAGGYYDVSNLPNVPVYVQTFNDLGYVNEYYPNAVAAGSHDFTGATALDLAAQATRTNIDIALTMGRTISGKVTKSTGGNLEDVYVDVYGLDGTYFSTGVTDGSGNYTVIGLPSGTYYVATMNFDGYIDEWYRNVVYVTHPDGAGATAVNVTSANASSINIALALGKTISGTVTNGSTGIDGAYVEAYDLAGNFSGQGEADPETGAYSITGLPAGQYRIATNNDSGYIDEWYNNVPVLMDIDGSSATTITISSSNATAKNFVLAMGRELAGEVTATDGGAGLEDIQVRLQSPTLGWQLYTSTDETGAYTFSGLPAAADYYVNTANGYDYIDEWYNNDPVPGDIFGDKGADTIDLTSASIHTIDFSLDKGYVIQGSVIDSVTSGALADPGMLVMVYNSAGDLVADNYIGDGYTAYTTWALPGSTTYYVAVEDFDGGDYRAEWFNDKKSSDYDRASATAVPIASAHVTGINFAMDGMNVYDQTNSHIVYSGAYTTYASAPSYGSSYARLSATGSSATIYFNGIRLDWVAMKGTTTGAAKVYVDDVLQDPVNLAASAAAYQQKVFSTGELPRGLHKVKIEWNATSGKFVTLDAVKIDGAIADAPPTVTSITPNGGRLTGGTAVSITGTALFGGMVTFDGLPAGGVSINANGTQLNCIAPAHAAGPVTVQVTTDFGSAFTTYTYADAPELTRYDQTNTNIVKSGTWTNYTSAGSHGSSYGRSSTAGASATVWFTGTQIGYVAFKGTTTGKADVYIDNVKMNPAPIDLYSATPAYQQPVWTSATLAPGLHSFKVVRSAASASGKYVTLDAVDIAGEIVAPPTRYQQNNTNIAYSAGWTTFSTSGASGSSYARANAAGSNVTITFSGTRLEWIATKGTTTGWADVYVDDVLVTPSHIDLRAAGATYQVTVWSSGTLTDGVHTVSIVRNDLSSAAGQYITLDAVDIWGTIHAPLP